MIRKLKCILFCLLSLLLNQKVQGQNPNWSLDSRSFDYQMQFTASLKIDGIASTNTNDQVAVFVGDELRGVGNITFNNSNQKYVSFFNAYSNTINETLTFKIYDSTNDTVLDAVQTKTFIINEQEGGVFQSFVISNTTLNDNADIISFNFQGISVISNSKTSSNFNIVVPSGTAINSLTPIFSLSNGANAFINFTKQNSNANTVDFSNPVVYQVLSEDEKVLQEFTINVTVATSTVKPTVQLSSTESSNTNKKQIPISINFSEPITGFTGQDFQISNAVISNITQVTSNTYSTVLTFINQGNTTVSIKENAVVNNNSISNFASNNLTFNFDSKQPLLQNQEHFTNQKYFQLTFSEDVSNVDLSDFILSGNLNTYFSLNTIQQVSANVYNVFYTGTTSEIGNLYVQINNNATITDVATNSIIKQNVEAYYLNNSLAPIFENNTPNINNIKETSFSLQTDINLSGTVYYVVLPNNATAPNATEVKNGTGSLGTSVIASGNANTNSGDFVNAFNISGLSKETAYDVYVVAEDDEPTPNLQASPSFVEVTLPKKTLPNGINMKDIFGGTFTLGDDNLVGSPDQKIAAPEYQVTLSSFAMSEAEITNSQYVEFLNAAYSEGLIEIITGTAGPDKDKKIVVGSLSSSYNGEVLYTLDGIRVLKDHGNEDGDNNEFTGSVEPENPLNIAYIGFNPDSQTFYVKDPYNIEDFNWKDICDYQDYGTTPMIFQGPTLNDFDDWAGAGANYSNELQGWTENNPSGATNLPTQTEVADWPVTFIRWRGAKAFADYYNVYLPTEAQWEYAAKGGANFEYAVYDGQSVADANWNQAGINNLATGHVRSAISGNANPFGLYNLAGNVWEWIADNYVAPYDTSITTNPFIEESGSTLRSWRGGAWNYHEATLQSSIRFFDEENRGNDHFGFRITGTNSSTDNLPPTLKTLSLQSTSLGNVTSITYTATFNEVVNLVSADDFIITKTGSSNGIIATPTTTDSINWQITINNITGDGTLRLDLKESATIQDDAGNTIQVSKTGDDTHTSDFTDPTFDSASSTPNHNGTNFIASANIVMAFSEDITFGTHKIVIREVATNNIIEDFDVTLNNTGGNSPASGEIGIVGHFLYINPTQNLIADGREYAIRMNPNAINDLNGNSFAGMRNNSFYKFSTLNDTTKPRIDKNNSVPQDNSINISLSNNIVIDFTEDIKITTGENGIINIRNVENDTTAYTFLEEDYEGSTNSPSEGKFGIINDKLYLNPNENFIASTSYSLRIIQMVMDYSGNKIEDITNDTNYNFLTQPLTWTGNTNSNWAFASNWNTNTIPTDNDDIVIPNTINKPIIESGTSAEANNITVEVSSNISIASGGSLTINGDLTNNGDLLAIGSGGSLIVNGSATGNISYTRNLPTSNWYSITSPVIGQDIDAFVLASNLTNGQGNNVAFGNYDNNSNSWSYYQNGSSNSGDLKNATGYIIKLNSPGNIQFTGTMPTTDISNIALLDNSNNSGSAFNFVGNPYPSYISATTLLAENDSGINDLLSESTIWVWNENKETYDTYNFVSDFTIAPTQGFFIKTDGPRNTFKITESMQSHQLQDTFQKNSRPEINIQITNGNLNRETSIYYINGTTTGFDNGYDSTIFEGTANNLSVYTGLVSNGNGEKLSIQSIPNSNYEQMIIPIGLISSSETITFTISEENIPNGYQIFLEDKETNEIVNLSEVNANYQVTFNEPIEGIGRFYLHLKQTELIWNGNVNTDWGNSANWNQNIIPTNIHNVSIPNVNNKPIINSNTNAVTRDISIVVSSGLTISAGGTLTVNGDLTNNGNTLQIGSGASLIVNGTSTGNISYTRSLANTNWYSLASPVVGQDVDAFVAASNLVSGQGNNVALGAFNPIVNAWSYYQNGTPFNSDFQAGVGHIIKLNAAGNVNYTGTMATEDFTALGLLDLSASSGSAFNLVGNPYPSYISANSVLTNNDSVENDLLSESTIWVWNQSKDTYDTYNFVSDFYIAPTQGFFVKAAGNASTFTITESMQSHQSETFQKSVRPEIKVQLSNGKDNRDANVYYINGTTTGFDNGYDSNLFGGVTDNLSVYTALVKSSNGEKLSIQSLPNANFDEMVIPIGLKANTDDVTFTIDAKNIPEGYSVFLEDKTTAIVTDLGNTGGTHQVTLNDPVDGIGRFYLHIRSSALSTTDVNTTPIQAYLVDNHSLQIEGIFDKKTNITVFDILGKQAFTTTLQTTGSDTVLLPNLSMGTYVVKITSTTRNLNKKIFIKH